MPVSAEAVFLVKNLNCIELSEALDCAEIMISCDLAPVSVAAAGFMSSKFSLENDTWPMPLNPLSFGVSWPLKLPLWWCLPPLAPPFLVGDVTGVDFILINLGGFGGGANKSCCCCWSPLFISHWLLPISKSSSSPIWISWMLSRLVIELKLVLSVAMPLRWLIGRLFWLLWLFGLLKPELVCCCCCCNRDGLRGRFGFTVSSRMIFPRFASPPFVDCVLFSTSSEVIDFIEPTESRWERFVKLNWFDSLSLLVLWLLLLAVLLELLPMLPPVRYEMSARPL